jgi:hypothetical protein
MKLPEGSYDVPAASPDGSVLLRTRSASISGSVISAATKIAIVNAQ